MGLFVPLLFGLGTGLPLVVGAVVGVYCDLPDGVVGAVLAFASGALITGLAFELFEPAYETAGVGLTTASLLVGTGAYVGAKYLLSGREAEQGLALLAAVIADGLAENLTLGVALVGSATGTPFAVLVGIAANNLPEAVGGARDMAQRGRSNVRTLGVWTATAAGLTLAVVAGYAVFAGVGRTALAQVRAAGGGAVLASLAVEIMPDAYEGGGPAVAFGTAAGFVVTFLLV